MSQERYPKDVVLKDGTEIILRTVCDDDLEKLVQFYKDTQLSFRWFLKEDPCDPEVVRKWLENQKVGKSFSIVATCQEMIVGNAAMLMRPYGGRKHVGRLRTMVAHDFTNKQLGTWMVFDLTKRAMEMGLEKIRADFVVGVEDVAIRAFRNMDFVEEGLLKNYIRDENGTYHDYKIMIKQLHRVWSDF